MTDWGKTSKWLEPPPPFRAGPSLPLYVSSTSVPLPLLGEKPHTQVDKVGCTPPRGGGRESSLLAMQFAHLMGARCQYHAVHKISHSDLGWGLGGCANAAGTHQAFFRPNCPQPKLH